MSSLWSHRALIAALLKREILSRYRGSFGGTSWYIIQNLCQLAIYTFVFGGIFKSRWQMPQSDNEQVAFAPVLFLGLILFNLFSESAARAPGLIVGNVSYVKKVVFPLEVLPVVLVGTSLFNAATGLMVFVFLAIVMQTPLAHTIVWLPLTMFPLVLIALGVSWFLAALSVFIRDTAQIVGLLTMGLMFFTPIFYPASALPESWRWLLVLNPLSVPIEQARAVALFGQSPDLLALSYAASVGAVISYLGWIWFQISRRGFADVL